MEFYATHELSYSLPVRSTKLTIQLQQSYAIHKNSSDKYVYGRNHYCPQKADGNENQDGCDIMGLSMSSLDDGQYRTMNKEHVP